MNVGFLAFFFLAKTRVADCIFVDAYFSTNSLSDDGYIANGLEVNLTCTYTLENGESLILLRVSEYDGVNGINGDVVYSSTSNNLANDLVNRASVQTVGTTVTITITSYDSDLDGPDYMFDAVADTGDSDSAVFGLPDHVYDQPNSLRVISDCDDQDDERNTVTLSAWIRLGFPRYPRPIIKWTIDGSETPCTADEYMYHGHVTTCVREFDRGDSPRVKAYLFNVQSNTMRCTDDASDESSEDSSGLAAGAIAGIVISVIAFIAVVVILVAVADKKFEIKMCYRGGNGIYRAK